MIYLLTILNAVILGVVAYLFYSFRKALESTGVRQIDDYLHELEGSVAQLTEQFERTSAKISKDLLRKTTELQSLIGECDAKLAHTDRLRTAGPTPAEVSSGRTSTGSGLSGGRASAAPDGQRGAAPPVTGIPTIPPALAARRLNASETLAGRAHIEQAGRPTIGNADSGAPIPAATAAGSESPVAVGIGDMAQAQTEQRPTTAPDDSAPSAAALTQPNEKYRLIFLLASEGMDTASIAKHTNLTRSEVEMLLDLRRQGKI